MAAPPLLVILMDGCSGSSAMHKLMVPLLRCLTGWSFLPPDYNASGLAYTTNIPGKYFPSELFKPKR